MNHPSYRLKAYGVTFRRSDIEQLKPQSEPASRREFSFGPPLRSVPTEPKKPLIFISYAHADEPERPAEGEIKWLSFVTGYLRPAMKHGAVDLWLDRLMPGGANWEREIELNFASATSSSCLSRGIRSRPTTWPTRRSHSFATAR